jgi:anti-sigma B factor antagonist
MSGNRDPRSHSALQIATHYEGQRVTLVLGGEFDMTGTALFWAHFGEAVRSHPGSIIIDARDLEFIDSSGLLAFVRAREAAVEAGATFGIMDPSPMLRHLADLTGLTELLLDE